MYTRAHKLYAFLLSPPLSSAKAIDILAIDKPLIIDSTAKREIDDGVEEEKLVSCFLEKKSEAKRKKQHKKWKTFTLIGERAKIEMEKVNKMTAAKETKDNIAFEFCNKQETKANQRSKV